MTGDRPLGSPHALKTSITDGFTAVAGDYDAGGREFFGPAGQWLVRAACVPAGAWVLDAGCGHGAVTLPAARAAGPGGHVTGIDLAAPMLAHTSARAAAAGLGNVSVKCDDAEDPSFGPGSFDVVLAGNVLQFLPRPAGAVAHWLGLLMPGGTAGIGWTAGLEERWGPVLAAVDAYVPDGVPAFAPFMRRPPFSSIAALEEMLTGAGYRPVATVTCDLTTTYPTPERWWAAHLAQGPWALSWRHIPPAQLAQAQHDALTLAGPLRAADGSLSRTLTVAATTARRPDSHAGTGPWLAAPATSKEAS